MTMKKTGWRDFLSLCRHIKNEEELDELFRLLLTLDEQDQISTRVQLLKALLKGDQTQRVIAEDLQISIAKITRGSNALKTISAELRGYLLKRLR